MLLAQISTFVRDASACSLTEKNNQKYKNVASGRKGMVIIITTIIMLLQFVINIYIY